MAQVRLNKYLAHAYGISRREADVAITEGRVKINNKVALLGNIINTERDIVHLDNQAHKSLPKRYTYLLLNKPEGYVCSRKQQGDNPTIYSLLPRQYHHLKVAGRLDKDSCGLLLLTDDGDAIFKLTHPKFSKEKVYQVALNKPLKTEDQKRIEKGVELEDGLSRFKVVGGRGKDSKTGHLKPNTYTITMHEGRNRQIRRTFKALGYTVTYLERTQVANYKIATISSGAYSQATLR